MHQKTPVLLFPSKFVVAWKPHEKNYCQLQTSKMIVPWRINSQRRSPPDSLQPIHPLPIFKYHLTSGVNDWKFSTLSPQVSTSKIEWAKRQCVDYNRPRENARRCEGGPGLERVGCSPPRTMNKSTFPFNSMNTCYTMLYRISIWLYSPIGRTSKICVKVQLTRTTPRDYFAGNESRENGMHTPR